MHGHVKYTYPKQYMYTYTYIYTHIRRKRRSRQQLRNNESHRRKPCKKKLKTRNIRKHVTHPNSHNPLFQLWGHASKSRQLPHLGKAFRQHLLPLQFMRDASKMSRTIGVSSARSVRNVASAGNSCVPKTWFAKRSLRSIFHQLPFWLSAFRLILTGNARSLDLDSRHCRSDAQLGDRV